MAKPMSPPKTITQGQIGKIQDLLGDKLRKNELPFGPAQMVIETQGSALAHELWMVVQKRVDAMSDMIVRRVKVDRSRSPQELLDATKREQYTDRKIVESMPRGEGEEKEVFFFKLGRRVSEDELAKEYELRGLVPDPYAQAQVSIDDPSFANECPNGTQWLSDGKWCFATFGQWCGDRRVIVRRGDAYDWNDRWWFAGVRK